VDRRLDRREFLRVMGIGAGAAALAACAPSGGGPAASAAAGASAEPLTLPIVTSPLSLSYWCPMSSNVAATMKTFGEIAAYKELEKRTGIHLNFQHPPLNQEVEQFNLVSASGTYPDVVEFNWLTNAPGGPARFLRDGMIIRLNDHIDKYAPNLKKVLADHPEWRKQIVTDEGDIYAFPFIRSDVKLLVSTGLAMRQDWLDKLGLKAPTTLDEWRTVLKAFKERDPNGNGKSDEIPLSTWASSPGSGGGSRGAFSRYSFIGAWGIGQDWYQERGAVKYGPQQPEFREFLTMMASWYKEGLIDADVFATTQNTFDAKVTNNLVGAASMQGGNGIGKYAGLMAGKGTFKLVPVQQPTLKAGERPLLGGRDNNYPGQGAAAITSSNKRVVETVKMLDYAYSTAGSLLFNFGIEGTSYTMVNGNPTYTDVVMRDPQVPSAQMISRFARGNFNGPFVQDVRYITQYYELPEQKKALDVWTLPVNEKLLPPITVTQDESKKFATTMSDINTRFDEVFTRVWSGKAPIDEWDGFVKALPGMGINDAIKIQQTALDRYNKRPG
jgi:putative aldouronate transport system substrate-binding protein